MSYDIVKKISFKDAEVFVTSAPNNISPITFHEYKSDYLSDLMKNEGFSAVVKSLAKNMYDGNIKVRSGTKLCTCLNEAHKVFERDRNTAGLLRFIDKDTYADYIEKHVAHMYERKMFDIDKELGVLFQLRTDKDAVFRMCENNFEAFLFADKSIQNNPDYCKQYVEKFAGKTFFHIPDAVLNDKETVLFALSKNGCAFRELPESMRGDKDIVLAAFGSENYPEHLPDLIAPELLYDSEFMKQIIDIEPKLHFWRAPNLLENKETALHLAKNAAWVLDFVYFPDEILKDKEMQEAIAKRLDDDVKPDYKERIVETFKKILLPEYLDNHIQKKPLDVLISEADKRTAASSAAISGKDNTVEYSK